MAQTRHDLTHERKLKFIELLDKGLPIRKLAQEVGIDKRQVQEWRDRIEFFGIQQFLMATTTKTKFSFEVKLAAVKDLNDGKLSTAGIMHKYGITTRKSLRTWARQYRELGEAGLMPKQHGRPVCAKNKPQELLSETEKLQLRIKELEAENAVLKKVMALKE